MSNDMIHVIRHGAVAQIEMRLLPPSYIDREVVTALVNQLVALDADDSVRAVVLCSAGKVFCAGASLGAAANGDLPDIHGFYRDAMKLYRTRKPMVAAVQGPAIGAGMGLAIVADFRVAGRAAKFSANFNRLGLHPGFGMSVTLPRLVGEQQAALLFYTGRRFDGGAALAMGLVDELVDDDQVLPRALELAAEIAASAPLAVESTRQTLRMGLADRIAEVNQRECSEQLTQTPTADFKEGVKAMAERRLPVFLRR